ncbi:uncharacterized protein BT62DRAFT_984253 [Guyanagaster necrorhizus]|uniref:SPIN90/Ldb17 leucine-rich domain-containing protein n=1 Tax=Guyanagaster necrorhizus TaxID=856835 RepID=A0A9P7W1N1_9AGAR|nr:uncharacterized protein BT62DRAFT_984253 [Guyanagaster necrorhizus MCA 3950]KAG7450939.1 hypothetical protein BT62DRAFT_984253 [Guyanagaster necrorhizus MCA 3950]
MSLAMEDDFGIVYVVENAQQFWSELDDILTMPRGAPPTLQQLDGMMNRWLGICAIYHELYLQTPLQLEHAVDLLLDSELWAFHSERMCENLAETAKSNTDPHAQLVTFNVLLRYGQRKTDFFRAQRRWGTLVPLLMDHTLVEIDENEDGVIEAKLRLVGVRLLYEVCRWQKLSVAELRVFDDSFIDYLFDLVEQTRHVQDETFNYSVIKLIVAFNEQFMVASICDREQSGVEQNRVLRVLMRRLGSSKTFGENMIFMLNRAQRTSDDLCMQLLVLKLIYLLFTTKGTEEYFYTNDLCVLVDVFLREVVDLDEDSESLRHTYLRVLHPLLTKTQLKDVPYKRPQIKCALESLVRDSRIHDINPTTKRLVERCLGGEWCVQLKKADDVSRSSTPSDSVAPSRSHLGLPASVDGMGSGTPGKTLKSSRSAENMVAKGGIRVGAVRRPSNASAGSFSGVATAAPSTSTSKPPVPYPRRKGTASSEHVERLHVERPSHSHHIDLSSQSDAGGEPARTKLRKPPPAPVAPGVYSAPPPIPPKRRKPPAVPVRSGRQVTVFETIKTSATSPLTR